MGREEKVSSGQEKKSINTAIYLIKLFYVSMLRSALTVIDKALELLEAFFTAEDFCLEILLMRLIFCSKIE